MADPDLDKALAEMRHRPPTSPPDVGDVKRAARRVRRRRRQRWGTMAATTLTALVLLGVVVPGGDEGGLELEVAGTTTTTVAPPEELGPRLTADPATGLIDGQQITLRGTGFPPGTDVQLAMCREGASRANTALCDLSTLTNIRTGADGEFTLTEEVVRTLGLAEGVIDCADRDGLCVFGAAGAFTNAEATTPLSFDPAGPSYAAGELAVTPSQDLLDDQEVMVTGSGFRPGDDVYLQQCAVSAPDRSCGYATDSIELVVGPDGAIQASFPVQRLLFDDLATTSGVFTDCVDLPSGCELRLTSRSASVVEPVPISFDPAEPVPDRPALAIDAAEPVALGQEVTVTGTGFQPGMLVNIGNCLFPNGPASNGGTCGYPVIDLEVGPDGSFAVELALIDDPRCAAGQVECGIAYYPGNNRAYARLPLDFVP